MRIRYIAIIAILVILVSVWTVYAGDPDSSSAPGSTSSYTLEDIYKRLSDGTAGAQSTFTEPTSGPETGTMHTINEVMAVAPALDNTNGATTADVVNGKTFWGLTAGEWGLQTGTAAGATCTGDATAGDVLSGKTFSNASATGIAGTMPDRGAVTIVPTTTNQAIAEGYHDGSGYVVGDTDLVSGNIKCGVTIFGVTGTILPECVAQTGQTTSYATGDDGEYQKGCTPVVAPSSGYSFGWYHRGSFTCYDGTAQFTDNGDETVTDNLTGLMWAENANPDGAKTWADALTYCNDLSLGGYDDWRLPNLNELRSPFDPTLSAPYLPAGHPFDGVQSDSYWSSTTGREGWTTYAWYVWLANGYVGLATKTSTNYVWPVRGGQ
jgi:hypothetical protein